MSDDTIAFIGGGNMARSLISGLLNDGIPADRIAVSDPVPTQRELLAEFGVRAEADNEAALAGADVVVLAVKPQLLGEVLKAQPELLQTRNLGSLVGWISKFLVG